MIEQFIEKWLPTEAKMGLLWKQHKIDFEQDLKSLIDSAVENKWISVSDELPKDKQIYIWWDGEDIELERYCEFGTPGCYKIRYTHWQPLPEKPKKE